jgi:hypothetical protein
MTRRSGVTLNCVRSRFVASPCAESQPTLGVVAIQYLRTGLRETADAPRRHQTIVAEIDIMTRRRVR